MYGFCLFFFVLQKNLPGPKPTGQVLPEKFTRSKTDWTSFTKSKTDWIPSATGPARVGIQWNWALSVARFAYIHEAEERRKKLFFFDPVQGSIKNFFLLLSFSPLFCNFSSSGPSGRLLGDTKQLLELQASGFAILFLL